MQPRRTMMGQGDDGAERDPHGVSVQDPRYGAHAEIGPPRLEKHPLLVQRHPAYDVTQDRPVEDNQQDIASERLGFQDEDEQREPIVNWGKM